MSRRTSLATRRKFVEPRYFAAGFRFHVADARTIACLYVSLPLERPYSYFLCDEANA